MRIIPSCYRVSDGDKFNKFIFIFQSLDRLFSSLHICALWPVKPKTKICSRERNFPQQDSEDEVLIRRFTILYSCQRASIFIEMFATARGKDEIGRKFKIKSGASTLNINLWCAELPNMAQQPGQIFSYKYTLEGKKLFRRSDWSCQLYISANFKGVRGWPGSWREREFLDLKSLEWSDRFTILTTTICPLWCAGTLWRSCCPSTTSCGTRCWRTRRTWPSPTPPAGRDISPGPPPLAGRSSWPCWGPASLGTRAWPPPCRTSAVPATTTTTPSSTWKPSSRTQSKPSSVWIAWGDIRHLVSSNNLIWRRLYSNFISDRLNCWVLDW